MEDFFQSLQSQMNSSEDAEPSLPPGLAKELEALGGSGDMGDMAGFGEKLAGMDSKLGDFWKHLDNMAAKDPKAYQNFIAEQAKEAMQQQSSASPAPGGKARTKAQKQGDTPKQAALICHTQMRNSGGAAEKHAAVHIWRAPRNAKYPVAPTTDPTGKSYSQVELREKRPPVQQPLPDDALKHHIVYSVECHDEALKLALLEHSCMNVLLEAAFAYVEEHREVQLRRDGRRLLTSKEDLPEKVKLTAAASQVASSLDESGSGRLQGISSNLLHEIATMGGQGTTPSGRGGGELSGSSCDPRRSAEKSSATSVGKATPKKPLIEDLGIPPSTPMHQAERTPAGASSNAAAAKTGGPRGAALDFKTNVINSVEGCTPVRIEVEVMLPECTSPKDVDLEVEGQALCLQIAGQETIIPLPANILVNSDGIGAKFDKKRCCLKITVPAATNGT
ncbi:hypothetical protein CYMTET_29597 [Cymbomonas tetramitiformis]|uniref:PIH1D1/2/3 CS-like domain-containing protein n=1 Tax=Cymbomonas tetramitiformis TaxID=36881 RepID=A0AAE0FKE9_9CHLO|nr:hypothetical protein CYMTET_29597 [Cymbomonas tetramitiformis]